MATKPLGGWPAFSEPAEQATRTRIWLESRVSIRPRLRTFSLVLATTPHVQCVLFSLSFFLFFFFFFLLRSQASVPVVGPVCLHGRIFQH